MGFFNKQTKEYSKSDNSITTEGFYIGSSEAEAEINSKIKLDDFFEDYLEILPQINDEKFIVTGRKGTGKSAIGRYIYSLSKKEPNMFCSLIQKTDIEIEKIVQSGKEQGTEINVSLLFEWIILTKLLVLCIDNESIKIESRDRDNIKKFLERNRGFIDIQSGKVIEEIKTKGFTINIEYLKRIASALLNKEIKIKEEKAEFYRLIPSLQEIIIKLLDKDKVEDNKYILVFDDLDVDLNIKNKSNINVITELIRVAKKFNNDIFGEKGLAVKIIILLRSDIVKQLKYNADTAKIFASYEVSIEWYEDAYRNNEDKTKLKEFICHRIKKNFDLNNIPYNPDIWSSFVKESDFHQVKSFKYILDHTFYRPRDIILLFKDISALKFTLPLTITNINHLIGKYAQYEMMEINNELSIIYSQDEILKIMKVLKMHAQKTSFNYSDIERDMIDNGLVNCQEIICELFNYSLIGNINDEYVSFKHRGKGVEVCNCDINKDLITHKILKIYFKQQN